MKPKPKNSRNQRISTGRQRQRQHVLEVKLRTSKERARRIRIVSGVVLKAILITGLIGAVWFGGQEAMRRFVWENPDYCLSDVRFTTDGTLTREQVMVAGGIVEGRNIFTIDIAKAHEAISKLPQVESVEMQRLLPDRVTINVTERRPVAWLTSKRGDEPMSSERAFLIDARGIVMRSRVVPPEYYNLPVISGVETENLAPGQRVNRFEIQSALELVRLNADSTRFPVRHIDVTKGYCLVVTSQGRAKITFGIDGIENQLSRLYRILDAVDGMHKELRTVNLILTRNTAVTFFGPEDEVQAEPEPPQDARPPRAGTPPPGKPRVDAPSSPAPVKKPAPSTPRPISTPAPKTSRKGPAPHLKKPFHSDQ